MIKYHYLPNNEDHNCYDLIDIANNTVDHGIMWL